MYNYPTTGIRNALMMTPTGQQAIQRYQFGGQTTTGGGLSDASKDYRIEDILAGRARFYNPLSYRDAKEEEISETLVGTSAEDPYLRRKKIIPPEDRGGDGGDPTLPVERTAENNFGWLDPFEKGLVSMFPFGSGPLMAAANQQAAAEKALGEYGSKHAPSMVDFLSYGLTDSSGLYDKVDEIMSNRNIAGRRSTGPFGEEKIDYTYQYEEPEEPLSVDLGGRVTGTGGSVDIEAARQGFTPKAGIHMMGLYEPLNPNKPFPTDQSVLSTPQAVPTEVGEDARPIGVAEGISSLGPLIGASGIPFDPTGMSTGEFGTPTLVPSQAPVSPDEITTTDSVAVSPSKETITKTEQIVPTSTPITSKVHPLDQMKAQLRLNPNSFSETDFDVANQRVIDLFKEGASLDTVHDKIREMNVKGIRPGREGLAYSTLEKNVHPITAPKIDYTRKYRDAPEGEHYAPSPQMVELANRQAEAAHAMVHGSDIGRSDMGSSGMGAAMRESDPGEMGDDDW